MLLAAPGDEPPEERAPERQRRTALRAWRRTRPFWAGVLLLLAGAELVAVTCAPLPVLVTLGMGGIAALGLGCALVVAGLFLWFLPHTRHYTGLHAVLLAVLSFPGSNLGGYFVGACLGIAGGSMGFAWTPRRPTRGEAPAVRPAPRAPAPRAPGPTPPAALSAVLPVVLAASLLPRPAAAPAVPALAVSRPQSVTASRFTTSDLTLTTVTHLPTADGQRKVLALRMAAGTLTDYRLRAPGAAGPSIGLTTGELRLAGHVTLYLSRFSGCLAPLLCLTFSADSLPPPPVLPVSVSLTRVRAETLLIRSDRVDGAGFRVAPTR
ncbi:DUF6114 domain-containing protein [Streptomyces netropsis]